VITKLPDLPRGRRGEREGAYQRRRRPPSWQRDRHALGELQKRARREGSRVHRPLIEKATPYEILAAAVFVVVLFVSAILASVLTGRRTRRGQRPQQRDRLRRIECDKLLKQKPLPRRLFLSTVQYLCTALRSNLAARHRTASHHKQSHGSRGKLLMNASRNHWPQPIRQIHLSRTPDPQCSGRVCFVKPHTGTAPKELPVPYWDASETEIGFKLHVHKRVYHSSASFSEGTAEFGCNFTC
jgi:hypothetical protein